MKSKKPKILQHEKKLLEEGKLIDNTHENSSSIWLEGESFVPSDEYTNVYRVMGDIELLYLLQHSELPDTQPYQAIVEGYNGLRYMEKYLNGKKYVDTTPTTIIEFTMKKTLFKTLFDIQHKAEDGVLSIGLGKKPAMDWVYSMPI
jgi:hypothetical protein